VKGEGPRQEGFSQCVAIGSVLKAKAQQNFVQFSFYGVAFGTPE